MVDILSQVAANFVSLTGVEGSQNVPMLTAALRDANIASFMQTLFNASIALGAMLAVLRIAYGGFLYMTSDIGNKKEQAKNTIREALIGLVLLLAIVLILQQINPQLTNLDFTDSINGAGK